MKTQIDIGKILKSNNLSQACPNGDGFGILKMVDSHIYVCGEKILSGTIISICDKCKTINNLGVDYLNILDSLSFEVLFHIIPEYVYEKVHKKFKLKNFII